MSTWKTGVVLWRAAGRRRPGSALSRQMPRSHFSWHFITLQRPSVWCFYLDIWYVIYIDIDISISLRSIPSSSQTWLAGKYTRLIGNFPIETPMNRVDFQVPRLMTPEGIRIVCGNGLGCPRKLDTSPVSTEHQGSAAALWSADALNLLESPPVVQSIALQSIECLRVRLFLGRFGIRS